MLRHFATTKKANSCAIPKVAKHNRVTALWTPLLVASVIVSRMLKSCSASEDTFAFMFYARPKDAKYHQVTALWTPLLVAKVIVDRMRRSCSALEDTFACHILSAKTKTALRSVKRKRPPTPIANTVSISSTFVTGQSWQVVLTPSSLFSSSYLFISSLASSLYFFYRETTAGGEERGRGLHQAHFSSRSLDL